jgi:hypothetical protein
VQPDPDLRWRATVVLSLALVVLGGLIVARTIDAGGGATSMGILVGVLFVLAGAGRLWVGWKRP